MVGEVGAKLDVVVGVGREGKVDTTGEVSDAGEVVAINSGDLFGTVIEGGYCFNADIHSVGVLSVGG